MASITLNNLSKTFGDNSSSEIVAVDGLDIVVKNGEFLVLVGPSGCGKSTTLRLIAGLESETSGDIELDDTRINDLKPKNRSIAMVFQNYALYPHMTVGENMAFGLKMTTDLSRDEIDRRVDDAANILGITPLLNRRPAELSGGQQQRVALGRAIVREPEVFLMDEPLSNLDAKLRTEMRTELQQLQEDLGITTIYVTHDQTEAMTMGDRIAVLNNAKLQQVGTPLECYYQPKNKFVAGFIGSPSMNFFAVEKESDENDVVFRHPEFTYRYADAPESVRTAQEKLTIGIRPESIILDENDENRIETQIDVVEPMGSINYVYFTMGDRTYTVSLSAEQVVSPGSVVPFVFPKDKIHIFDRSSGEAIKNCEAIPDPDDPLTFNLESSSEHTVQSDGGHSESCLMATEEE